MELRGLADFILGQYDNDGKLITTTGAIGDKGLFTVDLASSKGATQANVTNLSPTTTKIYGSDAVAEQTVGVPEPSVALAANDIPHLVFDAYSGLTADDTNGGMAAKAGTMTTGGLILHSHDRTGEVDMYMAFPVGVFTAGDMNLQTNQQTPTVVHDALTFAAQSRASDKLIYQKFYSDDDNFDYEKMLAFIFEGYVATPKA